MGKLGQGIADHLLELEDSFDESLVLSGLAGIWRGSFEVAAARLSGGLLRSGQCAEILFFGVLQLCLRKEIDGTGTCNVNDIESIP